MRFLETLTSIVLAGFHVPETEAATEDDTDTDLPDALEWELDADRDGYGDQMSNVDIDFEPTNMFDFVPLSHCPIVPAPTFMLDFGLLPKPRFDFGYGHDELDDDWIQRRR